MKRNEELPSWALPLDYQPPTSTTSSHSYTIFSSWKQVLVWSLIMFGLSFVPFKINSLEGAVGLYLVLCLPYAILGRFAPRSRFFR